MSEKKIYITFPTDKETLEFLHICQKVEGKTQPEIINDIIQLYKKAILESIKGHKNEETGI